MLELELTLSWTLVIGVQYDMKVKHNLLRQLDKHRAVSGKFFFYARNHALFSWTKQATFHAYMKQQADKIASENRRNKNCNRVLSFYTTIYLSVTSKILILFSPQKLFHFLFFSNMRQHYSASSTWFAVLVSVLFSLLSLSRSSALYYGQYYVY